MTSPDAPKTPRKKPGPKRTAARPISMPDRYAGFLNGTLKVEDLDDEELIRGQLKDKNGAFTGAPPRAIPRAFHQKVVRELIHRNEAKLAGDLSANLQAMKDIRDNPRAPALARLQAATYLYERLAGKIPDKMHVQAELAEWERDMEDVSMEPDL